MSTVDDTERFQKFLDDTLRPDYLKAVSDREVILNERHEYEVLLVAIQKIQESKCETLNTRVNLGHHFFVNAQIDKCDTIIVKMVGDIFAELPLQRATIFVEGRIQLLTDRAAALDTLASTIRAHMDVVLTSLTDYREQFC